MADNNAPDAVTTSLKKKAPSQGVPCEAFTGDLVVAFLPDGKRMAGLLIKVSKENRAVLESKIAEIKKIDTYSFTDDFLMQVAPELVEAKKPAVVHAAKTAEETKTTAPSEEGVPSPTLPKTEPDPYRSYSKVFPSCM